MIEHSKRPELRYDDHYARIYDDVTGMILADLYRLGRHKSREAATQELHVLGRKMAAAPELVEALRRQRCPRSTACTPDEPDDVVCGACRAKRAALKKAGVQP